MSALRPILIASTIACFRAAYDNDIDPDSAAHQAAAADLGGADDGIPTYAAVDTSKKKKKPAQDDTANYAVVDKSKKKVLTMLK